MCTIPCTLHYTLYTYTIHYAVRTIYRKLYTVHYTLYSLFYTLYNVHYTL